MLAVLGLDSDVPRLAVYLLVLSAALIWLGLVRLTYCDARARIARPGLVLGATLLAASVIGIAVYMIVRPALHLEDVREREMSIKSSEALIEVLADLREDQAEVHASVRRLEEALLANRQLVVAEARAHAQAPGAAEPSPQR